MPERQWYGIDGESGTTDEPSRANDSPVDGHTATEGQYTTTAGQYTTGEASDTDRPIGTDRTATAGRSVAIDSTASNESHSGDGGERRG